MEQHLQDSLNLLSKLLDEADDAEFYADFLRFQEQHKNGMLVEDFLKTIPTPC